jgi:hypothetical protein
VILRTLSVSGAARVASLGSSPKYLSMDILF